MIDLLVWHLLARIDVHPVITCAKVSDVAVTDFPRSRVAQ